MTEAELVRAAQGGDAGALEVLLNGRVAWVRRIARRFAGRGALEDDLVQVGLLTLWQAVEFCDTDRASLGSFGWRAVRRAIAQAAARERNHGRVRVPKKEARNMDTPITTEEGEELLEGTATDPTVRPDLRTVLEGLSDRDLHVIYRRYLCQWTFEEVGQELGLTRERIRQIEGRAMEKLGRVR